MKSVAAAAAVLVAMLSVPLPAGAHGGHSQIVLLSPDPVEGDYTMVLRVHDFTLADNPPGDDGDTGQIIYGIRQGNNIAACSGPCSNDAPWRTANTTFTYYGLKAGDVVVAALVLANDTHLDPPVYIERTVKNVAQTNPGVSLAVNGAAPHPGTPNPGAYTMEVVTSGITIVQPGVAENNRTQGHFLFMRNGQACDAECSKDADPETTSTSFTFYDLKVGDIIGAELLHNDGSPFSPAIRTLQVVALPTAQILSQGPRAGDYTMNVRVNSFTLLASASAGPNNAGAGHIHYMVKHKDAADFTAATGKADTPSATFTFEDLDEGDTIAAELVSNDHTPLSPRVMATQVVAAGEPQDPLAPGVGPILLVVLLGAAMLARSRRA